MSRFPFATCPRLTGLPGAAAVALLLFSVPAFAGGGMILRNDACIVTIGFYTAHFTAYQPRTSGNLEFCRELPDTGETIFVLDYLHASLSEVPMDFRIIRDLDGLGKFARWEDVQNLDDLEARTVFYQPPVVRGGGSFRVSHSFAERGDYIGIFTAGHPSNDNVYNAVFSFRVGGSAVSWPIVLFLVALLLLVAYLLHMKGIGASRPETAA